MAKFGIGQSVRRVEDDRLVTGAGQYSDDVNVAGQLWGHVVRSPHAHARIRSIDSAAAKDAAGVRSVITARELDAAGGDARIPCMIPMTNRDGSNAPQPRHAILASNRVRYVGDAVAFVVADTAERAADAADLIEVDYEPLDAVAGTAEALEPGRPLVHDECAHNLAFDWHHGEEAAVERALAGAAHVARLELVNNRVVCNAMEPRACVADYDGDRLTLHVCTQGGWGHRDVLAQSLGMSPEKVRVLTPDVGGGFGMKAFFYPEYAMAGFAARELGQPVKWTNDRSDSFLSDTMGRDHVTVAELALDADHRIQGLRVNVTANMGAYYYFFAPYIPTGAALKVVPGVYDVKAMSYGVKAVFTNTVPVDAYRGAGRPESIYCIERLMDLAAREVGIDPAELRRRNFIKPDMMPFTTTAGEIYDSGEFERVMQTAMDKAGYGAIDERRRAAAVRGKRRGIGMCYYIESTMGDPSESADIRFEEDGSVSIGVGTQSNGQGHETAYAQVLHDRLAIPFEKIRIAQGDTDRVKAGGGTGGSRSLTAEGMAILDASDKIVEKGKAYAAQHFEAAVADVEFDQGVFRVAGTDRTIDIMDLASRARTLTVPGVEGGLDAAATHELGAYNFPNGCHIAEVEVEPDTGIVHIVDYNIVDDFGVVLNPLLVEGQVHGGVVQGIGQALLEGAVYDDAGQLLTGSFMDYAMPRAANAPDFDFSTYEVRCRTNALGVKGCGEAGSVASPAAIINALVDALQPLGVTHIDMPATPEKVWRACQRKLAA